MRNSFRQRPGLARSLGATFFLSLAAGRLLLGAAPSPAAERVLREWRFDVDGNQEGWTQSNHLTDLTVTGGALEGRLVNKDPFVRSPQFDIRTSPWQCLDIRLRTDCPGVAEIYWTDTTDSAYGGFIPGQAAHFPVTADGQWHNYRVFPFWQKVEHIILIRLDLPRPEESQYGKRTFAVDSLRIVDLGKPAATGKRHWDFGAGAASWTAGDDAAAGADDTGMVIITGESGRGTVLSDPLDVSAEGNFWVSLEMAATDGLAAELQWAAAGHSGMQSLRFPIRADGRQHVYCLDLASASGWTGTLLMLGLDPRGKPGSRATVRRIAVGPEALGAADVECVFAGLDAGFGRVGQEVPLTLVLRNHGGTATTGLRIEALELPARTAVVSGGDWQALPTVPAASVLEHQVLLRADGPVEGPLRLRLAGAGAPAEAYAGHLEFRPPVQPTAYVPEPHPVRTEYEIGAFYFPGWSSAERWNRVRRPAPQRRPVLGWYDEANPECADWQIKWAVEHGISFFLVDWYWSAGSRHLEHWVHQAFEGARYRKLLKWCVMWANHNAPHTHSLTDQEAVTRYWIDHYFAMPEYYRIDKQPVVVIWSPRNMERDMAGKGGTKALLERSQELAREAGYPGICFVAMKWPEASADPTHLRRLRDTGFSMTSIYHFMDPGTHAADCQHYPFKAVANANGEFWRQRLSADQLPFFPNLSTGWDSRPWHGLRARVVHNRTVADFRRICEEGKRFADATGIRRLVLGPLNEWGEGSYIEPCRQYGFGMYEAIRDTFCEEPAGGWPETLTPSCVGLGPYDLAPAVLETVTEWDFDKHAGGWRPLMGVAGVTVRNGALCFRTTSEDPAVTVATTDLAADAFSSAVVRIKVAASDDPGRLQLFWATARAQASEAASTSVPLAGDGGVHDYRLPLADNRRWRGHIKSLRLDPGSRPGGAVEMEAFRLVPATPEAAQE